MKACWFCGCSEKEHRAGEDCAIKFKKERDEALSKLEDTTARLESYKADQKMRLTEISTKAGEITALRAAVQDANLQLDEAMKAIRLISSCTSGFPGDVVDIAQKVASRYPEKLPCCPVCVEREARQKERLGHS